MPNSSCELSLSVEPHQQEHHNVREEKQGYNNNDLTEDALFEIFLRLPLKSVCKFRCVSESCLSLFSSQSFLNLLFDKFVMTSCGGITPWTIVKPYSSTKLTYKSDGYHQRSCFLTSCTQLNREFVSSQDGVSCEFVLGSNTFRPEVKLCADPLPLASSNGLVLCSANPNCHKDYFIFNPFTRQIVSLLPRPNSERPGLTGFTFESSTGTYKVIHVPFPYNRHLTLNPFFYAYGNASLQIFSSDTSKWTTHEIRCSREVMITSGCISHLVNYSGIWYWIVGRGRMISYNDNHNNGGGGGGEYRLFDLPAERGTTNSEHRCLGESKGLLYYGKMKIVRDVSFISVWVFQDGHYSNELTWKLVCEDVKLEDYIEYSLLAFNPVDPNVVIVECRRDGHEYEVAYNIKLRKSELLHRSSHHVYRDYSRRGIVVTFRPTIIPVITS